MKKPLVTIVIPVYKVEEYLDRCLESVVNQTYKDLEIILVDDGSPDRCPQMCDDWAKKDERIRVIHQQNKGLSGARNTGIREAKGEYVYFLDSDDEITHDCIDTLLKPLEIHCFDFVMGDYELRGIPTCFPKQSVEGEIFGVKNISEAYGKNKWHCMAWNKLCNRSYILSNELFFQEGLIHEDELWSALLACTADTMYLVCKETYKYYIREQSITTKEDEKQKLIHYAHILKSFYKYTEYKNIYFDGIEEIEIRIKNQIVMYARMNKLSSYDIYSFIRNCDIRSYNTRWKYLKTYKDKFQNLGIFLPTPMGYVYQKILRKVLKSKEQLRNK